MIGDYYGEEIVIYLLLPVCGMVGVHALFGDMTALLLFIVTVLAMAVNVAMLFARQGARRIAEWGDEV